MHNSPLTLVASIIVLCVLAAQGLDRLIVNPPPPPQISAASAPAPPSVPQRSAALNMTGSEEQRIMVSEDGHYYANAEINGLPINHMLIDTGATYVALSYEDAANLGIFPNSGDFKYESHTANGVGHVAMANLREVRLGDIVLENVSAVVSEPGAQDVSLLGMSFLSRLSRVEATGNTLALRR
jgi:aspartyl protease family protein